MSVATRQPRPFVPSAAFEAALSLHQQGRLREAERLYREVLKRAPDHAGTLHHLGVVKAQQGKLNEAIRLIQRALGVDPQSAEILCDLGVALDAAKRYAEAISSFERALALKPGYVDAIFNLGNTLRAMGRHQEAVARFEQALSLRPGFADAHNNLGNSLHALHRYEEAIACFERALTVRPSWAQAHCNLGVSLKAAGRPNEAISQYGEALRIDPRCAEAHSNLGEVLRELGRLEEAVDHCRSAIGLRPDFAEAYNNLGNALQALHRDDQAIASYRSALELKPDFTNVYNNMGNLLKELGRFDEAKAAYFKSLEIDPKDVGVLLNLADTKQFDAGDPHLQTLQSLTGDLAALSEAEQMKLHFALGKACADLGEYATSFRHLLQGNALKRRAVDYDEAATAAYFERIRNFFGPDLIARSEGRGDPSRLPIFVLGMPRSGTTLVEQILASHRKVHGAGEIEDFDKVARWARTDGVQDTPYPNYLTALAPERLREIGARYVERLRAYSPTAERIVNKMPSSFLYVGLIHLALPNARIIHTRRNPIDTCVSCFTKLFAGPLDYTYELGELGRYYRRYDELMAHWRRVLPVDAMLEVPYEALVEDFEPWARRIVDYCGLEWDDACLAFHETKRPVRTASVSQVRRPIFKTSVGRWLAYKDLLEPLIRELPE